MKDPQPLTKLERGGRYKPPAGAANQAPRHNYDEAYHPLFLLKQGPAESSHGTHAGDLEERTIRFAEAVVGLSKKIPRSPTNDRLIDELVECGTRVGASYCEANHEVSRNDFRNIIGRCGKEAKETKFFLRMLAAAEPDLAPAAGDLHSEAEELHLIFASIFRTAAC